MNYDLIVTMPNGDKYYDIELIHQIEQAIDKALIPIGFGRIKTTKGAEISMKYYQFGKATYKDEI